ncbi:hypothetical protein V5799_023972 [Amblyomma americanum]|uniref:Evasin n=1 Tax=Amblyomma americanum TaxID=6943 RepID=A0AAQ4EDP2_AMBAM
MGLVANLGCAALTFILFQGLFKTSQSFVIDKDAGNVTVCENATKSPAECETDVDCFGAVVPEVDFRGFKAPAGTAGICNCTCYRFGNHKSYCVIVPPEEEYDYDKYYV